MLQIMMILVVTGYVKLLLIKIKEILKKYNVISQSSVNGDNYVRSFHK